MFIRKVKIHNFKCYRDFEITLEEGLNIVVGDNEAEKAKIALSTTTTVEINLPFISADATGPKHLVKTLTQS